MASKSNGAWQVTLFSYDTDGRVVTRYTYTEANVGASVLTTVNTTATYTRDLRDAITQRSLTVGALTWNQWYDYDARGLLWKVFGSTAGAKPGTPDVTYTYRPTGQVATRQFAGGPSVPFSYTIREQLAQLGDPAGTAYPFSAKYTYLANGTVGTSEFYSAGSPAAQKRYKYDYTTASYDALNRLKSADFSSWSGSAWTSTLAYDLATITYDLTGNLTALRRYRETATLVDNLTYTIAGTSNRLTTIADAVGASAETWDAEAGSFTYDANGNQLTAPGPYSVTAATYDPRNSPLSLTRAGTATTYRYDDGGQRITKQVGAGNTEVYVQEGAVTLGVAVVNAGGTVVSSHLNLLAGDKAIGRLPSGSAIRYYHTDLLGSTRSVVQGTTVLESTDYDPWGVVLAGRSLGSGTKEGFTSKERDAESGGLDYFGARHYMAALGRWNGVDRMGEQHPEWSVYGYVLGNPAVLIDPDGQQISAAQAKAALEFSAGEVVGFAAGVKSSVTGLVSALSHPVLAAQSLASLATDPSARAAAWQSAAAGIQERRDKLSDGTPYEKGQVAGEAIAFVAEMFVGAKGLGAAGKAARGVRAADELAAVVGPIGATGRLGETALKQLGGASQVYFRTSRGGRYVDQLVNGTAHESKVGYKALTSDIRLQIAKDVELMQSGQIQGAAWHFFQSPVTGIGGPSGPLVEALRKAGIDVIIH